MSSAAPEYLLCSILHDPKAIKEVQNARPMMHLNIPVDTL